MKLVILKDCKARTRLDYPNLKFTIMIANKFNSMFTPYTHIKYKHILSYEL